MIEVLPFDKLVPAADNPRRRLGDLAELAKSIAEIGYIIEPPVVTPAGNGAYTIVCGHRRVAAGKVAGLTDTECVVRTFDTDMARVITMLSENIARASLEPLDEAHAFKALVEAKCSQRHIAELVGCAQAHVSKRLSLLELPDKAKELLDDNKITVGDALELTKLAEVKGGVDRALKEAKRYGGDLQRAAHTIRADYDRAQKVKAVEADLRSKGVKVLVWPGNGWYNAKTGRRVDQFYEPRIDEKKHAKLACHAASVDPYSARTVLICTKPANHPQRRYGSGPLTEKEKQRRRELKVRRAALTEATEARAEVMRALLGRRGLIKGGLEHVAGQWVFSMLHPTYAKVACELLGIKPAERPHFVDQYDEALRDFAGRSAENLLKAALAVAFGAGEAELRDRDHPECDAPKAARHYAFLEAAGYKRAEIEAPSTLAV